MILERGSRKVTIHTFRGGVGWFNTYKLVEEGFDFAVSK